MWVSHGVRLLKKEVMQVVNVRKIRGRMVEVGVSVKALAEALALDSSSLYRRFSNPETFTVGEAVAIKERLGLSEEDASRIFFASDVASDATIRCR